MIRLGGGGRAAMTGNPPAGSSSACGILPNFLICGAEKAGTTSLYHYLRRHPDVFMPAVKETMFFNRRYDRGVEWYRAFFVETGEARAVGEATALYMWCPEVPARIASLIPDARLIFLLRDPIARAYSNYWYYVSLWRQDPGQSFTEAIRTEQGFRRYVSKGFYQEQLERFLKHFDRAQLRPVITERLQSAPAEVLRECAEFLDIDPYFTPDRGDRQNITSVPRNPLSARLQRVWSPIRRRSKRLTPAMLRRATRPLRERMHDALFVPRRPPTISVEDRDFLRRVYEPHNQRLSEFLGQDVGRFWR